MYASPVKQAGSDVRPPRAGLAGLDLVLLAAALGLVAVSVYTLTMATQDDVPGSPLYYVVRQAIYGVVGVGLMLAVARLDISRLREHQRVIYVTMVGLIALVFVFGVAARGSKRWIELPFFRFQPSELGKVLLIVALSAFVVDRVRRLGDREVTGRIVLLALFPAVLVVAQPDLGSGLVYLAIAVVIMFVAGTKWTHLASLAGLATASVVIALLIAPAVGVEVLKPYQVDRLTAFVNPTEDPQKQGYQLRQSITAIGAGQKLGRGTEGATQTRLDFLPEHHTDFVFSVVGEQFGFLGAALVLSLYALLLWRALRILTSAKNLYGTLVASGVTAMLMFQVFVNVGMTIGIMPITGVPLPLMSYGGSSVFVTLLAIGLLQSVNAQARATELAKARELAAA
ncbi:MAG: rod shape-determining protein RodA [Thermoleophilaceae bacterium]|jgi:rod shape determining protein RodA|nr:rod shape-determining protein RodA [Thermoleophilaceae bacterium]